MNILIIKIGALGDVLRTSFIAQALKEKYLNRKERKFPDIYWITSKTAAPLFANNPYVTQTIISENRNSLRKINFDLIINLEEDEDNCKFAASFNTRIVGFNYCNGKIVPTPTAKEWFDMSILGKKPENDILKKKNKKTHRQIISEILELKDYQRYEPFLRLTQHQRDFAENFLRRHNLSRKDLIIGINTGSADRWPKQLSVKKTVELINKLYSQFNAKILLFGGPEEIVRNAEIQKFSKSPVIDTGCGNNLFEFPALISICNTLITSDTFGLHVALALKRKTICLIGPTSSSEIDMYGLGEKITADSPCVCCYKRDCKSMEKINLNKIIEVIKKNINVKISLLITAFKEPNLSKAIESCLNQKTNANYEIIISAPDDETLEVAKKYSELNKKIKLIKDPGKGKAYALNFVFSKINTDILILTDGDVFINENAVEEISNLFMNPEIGCVSGRPVPMELKNKKYGYWAHFLFDSAHRIRDNSYQLGGFIECSGYLFAFRKQKINQIPVDVAEDTIIPYLLWQKGYRIGYAAGAKVYVKNANRLKDWIKQKIRTHKSHMKISKYVDTETTPQVKTFKNELRGIFWLLNYPETLKELFWSSQLALFRFYTWFRYYIDLIILHRYYQDGWERIESTK